MKKTITTILMLFTISIGANAQIALGNGLSACYPFTGNANDVSGNNYNGTVVGATLIPDRYGSANCAYNFNGNAYINLSDILNNVWVGSGNKFSISVWVKPNATLTNNIIIGKSGDLACSENQRQLDFTQEVQLCFLNRTA